MQLPLYFKNQIGGDVLSKSLINFIPKFLLLQEAAISRKDSSFAKINPAYIQALIEIADTQKNNIEKIKKIKDMNERKETSRKLETGLADIYNQLNEEDSKSNMKTLEKMKDIFLFDPSISDWVITSYINRSISMVEDIGSRLKPAIEDFSWLQKEKIIEKEKKITSFKGLKELEKYLTSFEEALSDHKEQIKISKEYDLVFNGKDLKIFHPQTRAASCYLGQGTKWCTIARKEEENMFEHYNEQGPLYILQPKTQKYNTEKYQLHFESTPLMFMDELDNRVSCAYLIDRFPELGQVQVENFQNYFGTQNANLIKLMEFVKENDLESAKTLLSQNPHLNLKERELCSQQFLLFQAFDSYKYQNEFVKLFLEHGADPSINRTFLSRAIQTETSIETIKLLMEHGARSTPDLLISVNYLNPDKEYTKELVKLLIEDGADVNAVKHDGIFTKHEVSVLDLAINGRNKDVVEILLTQGAISPKNRGAKKLFSKESVDNVKIAELLLSFGLNKDIFKVQIDDVKSVEDLIWLIQNGADVNYARDYGMSRLHQCASWCRKTELEIAKVLINTENINIDIVQDGGLTPLDLAIDNQNINFIKLIISRTQRGPHESSLENLFRRFKDSNCKSSSPTINIDIANILIEHFANLDKNLFNQSFPYLTNINEIKWMLTNGANLNSTDLDGNPLLYTSLQKADYEIARFLIQKGALVNYITRYKRNSMHSFVIGLGTENDYQNAEKIAQLLIDSGADVNQQDFKGDTPLHLLVKKQETSEILVLKLLIKNGANINLKNNNNHTPIHDARSDSFFDILINNPSFRFNIKDFCGSNFMSRRLAQQLNITPEIIKTILHSINDNIIDDDDYYIHYEGEGYEGPVSIHPYREIRDSAENMFEEQYSDEDSDDEDSDDEEDSDDDDDDEKEAERISFIDNYISENYVRIGDFEEEDYLKFTKTLNEHIQRDDDFELFDNLFSLMCKIIRNTNDPHFFDDNANKSKQKRLKVSDSRLSYE